MLYSVSTLQNKANNNVNYNQYEAFRESDNVSNIILNVCVII